MNSASEWDILAALPFLAAAGGIAYIAIVALGGTALRLHRKRKLREFEARRRQQNVSTPWNTWLREINEQAEKQSDRADR